MDNFFWNAGNQNRGCCVWSKNGTSVLCKPLLFKEMQLAKNESNQMFDYTCLVFKIGWSQCRKKSLVAHQPWSEVTRMLGLPRAAISGILNVYLSSGYNSCNWHINTRRSSMYRKLEFYNIEDNFTVHRRDQKLCMSTFILFYIIFFIYLLYVHQITKLQITNKSFENKHAY